VSKAALWRKEKGKLAKRAADMWRRSPRYGKLEKIDRSMLSKSFMELVDDLPRKKASILMQLRTGHVPLCAHLFRITHVDSPTCDGCKGADKTVHHFLMCCPAHKNARKSMVIEGGRSTLRMGRLLNDKKMLPHLFDFIRRTKRFSETIGDMEEMAVGVR
jgi:hypothetical protein